MLTIPSLPTTGSSMTGSEVQTGEGRVIYSLITLSVEIICWMCLLGSIGYGIYRLCGRKKRLKRNSE